VGEIHLVIGVQRHKNAEDRIRGDGPPQLAAVTTELARDRSGLVGKDQAVAATVDRAVKKVAGIHAGLEFVRQTGRVDGPLRLLIAAVVLQPEGDLDAAGIAPAHLEAIKGVQDGIETLELLEGVPGGGILAGIEFGYLVHVQQEVLLETPHQIPQEDKPQREALHGVGRESYPTPGRVP